MSPQKRVPRQKNGKPDKREREKHGACKSCVFSYRKRRSPREEAVARGSLGYADKKRLLVDAKGGKCSSCGYGKCLSALTFHHTDRGLKSFTISANLGLPMDVLEKETAKCILLCLNCHAEVNQGLNGNGQ